MISEPRPDKPVSRFINWQPWRSRTQLELARKIKANGIRFFVAFGISYLPVMIKEHTWAWAGYDVTTGTGILSKVYDHLHGPAVIALFVMFGVGAIAAMQVYALIDRIQSEAQEE